MNKFVSVNGRIANIFHNGVVTRKGATKKKVLEFIESHAPYLVDKNSVVLGEIDFSKNLYMDSEDVIEGFTKMIEYSINRDAYKNNIK